MGQILAYLLTAFLTVCFAFQLVPKGGNAFPRSWAVISLLAIAILWTVVLWKGMSIWLKVPLMGAFLLLLISAPIISGLGPAWVDRPRREAPITIGGGDTPGSIAIVYHPGGTDLTRKAIRRLGEDLAARGYTVSILTAHPRLSLGPEGYKAIILGSPVYFGEVRPPIQRFISEHAFAIPVFAVLTGSVAEKEADDLERLSKILAQSGGSLRAGVKILSSSDAKAIEGALSSLADAVDMTLKGKP